VVQRLGRVIEEMREYIYELTSEQNRPLQERIEELVRSFSTATDLRTEVAIVSPLDLVGADRVDIAGRIVQEALTNVHRHAKASSIVVSVDVSDGILQLEVKDDGVGFDPGAERGDGHRGLRNISSRVDNLGGTLDIDSAPSAGTRIRARIPLA
jgi:signal transduction histidine kinase